MISPGRHRTEEPELGQQERGERDCDGQRRRTDRLADAGDGVRDRVPGRLAFAQPLAEAEEQEEDVVGADAEQHDDQERGQGVGDLEVERISHYCDERVRDHEHQPNHQERHQRGGRAAEDGGEEYEDEHDRRDADDQLAARERVRSVDDDRRVPGEAGHQAGARKQRRRPLAQRAHRILDALVPGIAREGDLHQLHPAVRRDLLRTAHDR